MRGPGRSSAEGGGAGSPAPAPRVTQHGPHGPRGGRQSPRGRCATRAARGAARRMHGGVRTVLAGSRSGGRAPVTAPRRGLLWAHAPRTARARHLLPWGPACSGRRVRGSGPAHGPAEPSPRCRVLCCSAGSEAAGSPGWGHPAAGTPRCKMAGGPGGAGPGPGAGGGSGEFPPPGAGSRKQQRRAGTTGTPRRAQDGRLLV